MYNILFTGYFSYDKGVREFDVTAHYFHTWIIEVHFLIYEMKIAISYISNFNIKS
jgi:hypothetical protein